MISGMPGGMPLLFRTLALLLFAGCGPAVSLAPGPTGVAFVSPSLRPLVDGAPLRVVHGPQGGWHLPVTLLAHGVWPGTPGEPTALDVPVATMRAFRPSGVEVTLTTDRTHVIRTAWERAGDGVSCGERQLRLAIASDDELANQRILMRVELVDRDGRMAMDEKTVLALPPTR